MAQKSEIAKISDVLNGLFAQLRVVFLPRDKKSLEWHTSLPAVYRAAVEANGGVASSETENHLVEIADAYLDAVKSRMQARILQAGLGNETADDTGAAAVPQTAKTVMDAATAEVERIVATETQNARSLGAVEGIGQVAASQGVEDPTVFFVVVRDTSLCDECKDVHLLADGITPRLWKLSEVSGGYHVRGSDNPSVSGLHPHCRCSMTYLAPGFGLNARGFVQYVAPGYDALEAQRRGE